MIKIALTFSNYLMAVAQILARGHEKARRAACRIA